MKKSLSALITLFLATSTFAEEPMAQGCPSLKEAIPVLNNKIKELEGIVNTESTVYGTDVKKITHYRTNDDHLDMYTVDILYSQNEAKGAPVTLAKYQCFDVQLNCSVNETIYGEACKFVERESLSNHSPDTELTKTKFVKLSHQDNNSTVVEETITSS